MLACRVNVCTAFMFIPALTSSVAKELRKRCGVNCKSRFNTPLRAGRLADSRDAAPECVIGERAPSIPLVSGQGPEQRVLWFRLTPEPCLESFSCEVYSALDKGLLLRIPALGRESCSTSPRRVEWRPT